MKRFLVFSLQILVVAIVGYILWYAFYGRPDVPFFAWLIICFGAACLGLIPYLMAEWWRRKK